MAEPRVRLPMAIAVTAAAAVVATVLLRPHSGQIDPSAIDATAYFSRAQIDRARAFAGTQRWIGLGQLVVSAGALVLLAVALPTPARRLLGRLERRPLLGGALVGGAISVTLAVASIPLGIWAHERAVDFRISTQSLAGWFGDLALSTAIGALLAALGGAIALALIRRFPRRWWIAGSAVVIVFAVIGSTLWPVLVDPLFNRFEPLPRGPLRTEVLRLADRAGVSVGQVYRVDASRRTTSSNAYVVGLGHTKRVVLYDNLIRGYPRDEVRSVVAHELGHVHSHDVPRGLLFVALVTPAGMWLAQTLAEAVARSGALQRGRRAGPAALPAVALSLGLVVTVLTWAGNPLSRRVEAHADAFALRLTDDPRAFVGFERRIAVQNVNDPDPPALWQDVFGTHPTSVQRIGAGVRYRREGRRALSR